MSINSCCRSRSRKICNQWRWDLIDSLSLCRDLGGDDAYDGKGPEVQWDILELHGLNSIEGVDIDMSIKDIISTLKAIFNQLNHLNHLKGTTSDEERMFV